MALSRKQIYNNALSKVCRKRISSVDEESFESNLCNSLYDTALIEVLWEHSWSSAIKRIKLVETAGNPLFAYEKSFQLPNDYIRLVQAYKSTDNQDFDFEWELSGKLFLANYSDVYIKYISLPTSDESMNMPLTTVVTHKLAIALSYPMKADESREAQLVNQYESLVLPRAKSVDSMENRFVEFEENPWVESLYDLGP